MKKNDEQVIQERIADAVHREREKILYLITYFGLETTGDATIKDLIESIESLP